MDEFEKDIHLDLVERVAVAIKMNNLAHFPIAMVVVNHFPKATVAVMEAVELTIKDWALLVAKINLKLNQKNTLKGVKLLILLPFAFLCAFGDMLFCLITVLNPTRDPNEF